MSEILQTHAQADKKSSIFGNFFSVQLFNNVNLFQVTVTINNLN